MKAEKSRGGAAIKAALLILLIIVVLGVVRFTPARECLTPEALGGFVERSGIWAPAVYIFLYAAGVCLFLPGTLLATIGAALFGPYFGFAYVWLGAMIGASAAFFIGRYLGRDFAASLIGERLGKYDETIERKGFATVLYLRLVYFPFTPMNFGMGLTRVRFRDYFFGTALGIVVGTFIFTFFVGTIKEIWSTGRWEGLVSREVLLSLGLFIFSFFIPRIVEALKAKRESHRVAGLALSAFSPDNGERASAPLSKTGQNQPKAPIRG